MTLPLADAIARFKANEERVEGLVNGDGYTTTGGAPVESLPDFLVRVEAEIEQTTGSVASNLSASQAAKTAAEAARDAAVVNSTMYPDEATGRAAVADGAYFKVIGTGDVACSAYRRTNSSTSVLVATYPSKAKVDRTQANIARFGRNRYTNSTFTKDAVGSLSAGGAATAAPSGYSVVKAGTAGLTFPASAIVEKANKDVRTFRALELTLNSTSSTGNDYQVSQIFDIPAELQGDVSATGRFVYSTQITASGITTGCVAEALDANNNSLGLLFNNSATTPALNIWGFVAFDFTINNVAAKKVRVHSRIQAPIGSNVTNGKAWITGLFFNFNAADQSSYDRNLQEEVEAISDSRATTIAIATTAAAVAPVAARVTTLEGADAVAASWRLGTNSAKNALFTADALGTQTPTNWGIMTGGVNSVMAARSVETVKTPFGTNQALRSTHYFNGTTKTDIQPSQVVDIPPEFWGDTTLVARFIYYVRRESARIDVSSYSTFLDANSAELTGQYPTKVSTDGGAGVWFPVIFNLPVTNANARKVRFNARLSGPGSGDVLNDTYAYVSGVFVGWNRSGQSSYDRNLEYEMEKIATAIALEEVDVLRQEIGGVSELMTLGEDDVFLDANGHLSKAVPSKNINCWGDSLTAANYAARVATLFGGARSVINNGIGGESSTQIKDRVLGHAANTSGITWSTGTIRLKSRRVVPPRMIQESYRSSWSQYGVTVAEPSKVDFYNDLGLIGTSYSQLKAVCSVSGDTFSATAHPFSDGNELYFLGASLPTGMYPGKVYYVRDASANAFKVAEFSGGASVSFGAGSATALGPFYFDWAFTAGMNTNIRAVTYTDKDSTNCVLWMGVNNVSQVETIKADIRACVAHLKTLGKRVLILTLITNSDWTIGTANYNSMTAVNDWLKAEYPSNHYDILAFLRSQYNPAIPQDVTDYNNGITPSSLRVDGIHLNTTGNNLVADKVYEFFNSRGW